MKIRDFINHHFRHFNAAALKDAAVAYEAHLNSGGKMMVTLAGAMSSAEMGISLAEMIRQDKIHAITCTGAQPRRRRVQLGRSRPLRSNSELPGI